MRHYKIVRNIEFGRLFELFFVSAIVAILGIRFYLRLTGFPQISAGDLHIAHMMWGGLCMMFSILAFMLFLNDDVKTFSAVLGGIGFGTFIDEVGKFVTKDNNYFYQPAFAIMYVVFVCLYLLYKTIEKKTTYTKDEYLINSLEELKEVIIKDLDKEEKTKALDYLSQSHKNNAISKFLHQTFHDIEDPADAKRGYYTKLKHLLTKRYRYFLNKSWFLDGIVVFFLVRSVWVFYNGIIMIVMVVNKFFASEISLQLTARDVRRDIQVLAIILQGIFTILGVLIIRSSRRRAYVFFKNAVLISIFVLQIFNFYRNPATALLVTLGDLLLLSILNYMIKKEDLLREETLMPVTKDDIRN